MSPVKKLSKNFLQGVVKLHKVSYSIVSELGFTTSSFWVMKGGEKDSW